MRSRHGLCAVVVLVAVLTGCGSGSRGSRAAHDGAPLAVLTTVETSHHGMGSTQYRVQVDAGGQVWRQQGPNPRMQCYALDGGRLAALQDAIRRAFASGLRELYNTSSHPTPNANYARSKTLELAVDGRSHRLEIAGWADVPPEVSQILSQLSDAIRGCP